MADCEECAAAGGTFSIKMPDISNAMVRKTGGIGRPRRTSCSPASLGCLMNMAGKLTREGRPIGARHVAEVLAGELSIRRSASARAARARKAGTP